MQAGKGVGYVKDGQKFETAKIDEKKEAFKAGYRYIFDIALERARRAGDKILKNLSEKLESGKNLGKKSAQERISSNKNQSQMSDLLGFERSEKDSSKTSSLASLAEASSQLDIGFKVMTVTESAVNRKLMNKSTASKEEIFAEIAASYGYGLNYAVREFKNLGEGIFYLEGNDREAMIILGEEQMKNEVLKEIILASDEFSNCQIFAADAVLNVEIIHNLYQHFEQKKVVVF